MTDEWTTRWKAARLPRALARKKLESLRAKGKTLPEPVALSWSLDGVDMSALVGEEAWRTLGAGATTLQVAKRGSTVLEESRHHVFAIAEGAAKLCRVSESGRKWVEALLARGNVFGRIFWTAGAAPRDLVVEGLEPTTIWRVGRESLERHLTAHPQLALTVAQRFEEQQRNLSRRLEALVFKDLRTRVVEMLLALVQRDIGQTCDHGFAVDVRLSQQDLADLVGATRQRVNLVIRELSRAMYVQRIGRVLCILDLHRLKDLVEEPA